MSGLNPTTELPGRAGEVPHEPWFDDLVLKLMRAASRRCGPQSRIARWTDQLHRAVPEISPVAGERTDE